jgi:hypothetical protein
MRKAIAVAVCAGLAILPGSALAGSRAKVYRGTFQAVGADGAYTDGKLGKAQLVDGKRNDKLSVHVRHLGGRTRYVFRLMQAPTACEEGAPGGTEVRGWRYRRDGVLKTSKKGDANSWARSKTFGAQSGVEYFVGVFTATPVGDPASSCCAPSCAARRPSAASTPHQSTGTSPARAPTSPSTAASRTSPPSRTTTGSPGTSTAAASPTRT